MGIIEVLGVIEDKGDNMFWRNILIGILTGVAIGLINLLMTGSVLGW